MKQRMQQAAQPLVADRGVLGLLVVFTLLSLVTLILLALNIQPSELQVVTHYSSFGSTNFYRDKWYYLLSFIGFLIVFLIMHITLVRKLLVRVGRSLAIAYAWLGIIMVVIFAVVAHQILNLASLT